MGLTSARTITASANQPRAAFIDIPLGHTSGPPNDPAMQRRILGDALAAAAAIDEPGTIIDLPLRWSDDEWKVDPLSWSRRRQDAGESGQPAGDSRSGRSDEPRYQTPADAEAADAVDWDDQCLVCIGVDPTSV